ncbi:MAG: hypothetical protein Q8K79_08790 [Solirubrobacteraceae bacterium]|nr:hypothetical protein [Solirubrobacteraceae bacterium]
MRTTSTLVAIITAAFALQVSAAQAEPPLRDVGPASTDPASGTAQVIANRGRVAYTLGGGRVRVINERLAEAASVTEAGCAWRGFGAGQLLWNCHAAAPGYPFGYSPLVALDGRQRIVLGPPPLPPGGHGELPIWWGVGLHWMTVYYDADTRAYVNRTTGRVVYSPGEVLRARRHVRLITDVDQDDLTRSLCAPLVPKLVPGEERADVVVAPLAYRSPYGATRSGSRLLIGRCGARRLTVLSGCARTCSDPVVGDGFVAWMEGTSRTRTLNVRLLGRGRTWRWRVDIPAQPSQHLLAALGRRLFILAPDTLKTVRLPAPMRRR